MARSTSLVEATHRLGDVPCRVFFKNELEQPSGSFKLRGIGHLISKRLAQKEPGKTKVHVYSSSGGNAGLAAVYASKELGVACTVVLPQTSAAVVGNLEKLGATVIMFGDHWGIADDHLRNVVMKSAPSDVQTVYVHPFDDPVIWAGHATLVDEIQTQLSPNDVQAIRGVVCSVGGGGLYNGVVEGLKRNGMDETSVLAIETFQTPTFSRAVENGEVVTLSSIKTTTTSLASPYLSQKALENYREGKTVVKMVDDLEAKSAAEKYHEVFGKKVEASCGAALTAVLGRKEFLQELGLTKDDIVVVVVCGGVVGI